MGKPMKIIYKWVMASMAMLNNQMVYIYNITYIYIIYIYIIIHNRSCRS